MYACVLPSIVAGGWVSSWSSFSWRRFYFYILFFLHLLNFLAGEYREEN